MRRKMGPKPSAVRPAQDRSLDRAGPPGGPFRYRQVEALAIADPEVPAGLNDRELDGWRPLLAIADMGGTEWAKEARRAALTLSEGDDDDDEPALMLLVDCRKIFDEIEGEARGRNHQRRPGEKLHGLEDRPWNEWGRMQKPITANGVARLLKRYEIRPGNVGTGKTTAPRLRWAEFDDAWKRYGGGA